jgi:hypothetical protein
VLGLRRADNDDEMRVHRSYAPTHFSMPLSPGLRLDANEIARPLGSVAAAGSDQVPAQERASRYQVIEHLRLDLQVLRDDLHKHRSDLGAASGLSANAEKAAEADDSPGRPSSASPGNQRQRQHLHRGSSAGIFVRALRSIRLHQFLSCFSRRYSTAVARPRASHIAHSVLCHRSPAP